MHPIFLDLIRHKWHANANLLTAIHRHDVASHDKELRKLLHHVLLANRYWLLLILQIDFSAEQESRISTSLDDLVARYRETERQEMDWISKPQEADTARILQTPFLPGRSFTIDQAITQVCMHSHGHRAQCATLLRSLGGVPPPMDFILWLKDRPTADWPSEAA